MPKDKNQRIEGIFGQIGLGNMDPERILEIQEEYERAMALADFMRSKKGRHFDEALRSVEAEVEEKEKEEKKKEEDKPEA